MITCRACTRKPTCADSDTDFLHVVPAKVPAGRIAEVRKDRVRACLVFRFRIVHLGFAVLENDRVIPLDGHGRGGVPTRAELDIVRSIGEDKQDRYYPECPFRVTESGGCYRSCSNDGTVELVF